MSYLRTFRRKVLRARYGLGALRRARRDRALRKLRTAAALMEKIRRAAEGTKPAASVGGAARREPRQRGVVARALAFMRRVFS